MKFESLRGSVKRYRTGAGNPVVATQLRTLISKSGYDIFKDIGKLSEGINTLQLSQTVKTQLCLIFQSSSISDYLLNSRTDFSFIDVDNTVHNAVIKSGLSYGCIIKHVADIFYACGLDFAIEYGPQLVGDSIEYKLHAIMPSDMVEFETAKTESLVRDYENAFALSLSDSLSEDEKNACEQKCRVAVEKAVGAIQGLCAAGVPKGFYLLGRCYLYGDCATAVDFKKAVDLMKLASERGVPEAAASLADIYYRSDNPFLRDYTLSEHYYTRPGALAMGRQRQQNLRDIYRQRDVNGIILVFSIVMVLLTAVFISLFRTGLYSGAHYFSFGIIMAVMSTLSCAAGIWYRVRKKFNSIRVVIAVQYFLWVAYAAFLLLK